MTSADSTVASGRWQFWVDRGGTFTDIVAQRPDGHLVTCKLLSDDPRQYDDAVLEGIRRLLGTRRGEPIPSERVDVVKMGTTVATNALLERTGEPTLLVVTAGFRDVLRIAYQNRPRIFDRRIMLPDLVHSRVVEALERVSAHGEVLVPLDEDAVREELQAAYDDGLRAVAVLCLHGYRFPQHEQAIGRIAAEVGYPQVSLSHEVSPLMRMVARGDTTVVDAYLSPILRRYVDRVTAPLASSRLMFMQSNGGLTEAHHFRGKDAILSGPAGGVVGMSRTAVAAGFSRVIGFDMGGTSTDVCHYAGELERELETVVAGVRLRAPMLSIHTVAAGGGSVLHFDGSRYRVGPDSAGADPGPAAYRNGGPLTVTDANVMLGRIHPDRFPRVFGPAGDEPLDVDVVRKGFEAQAAEISAATGDTRGPEQVAAGYLRIAVANMASAIKKISVQRGYDVTRYALATFGGAGGQHACAVADELGITTVLIHPFAGVLSAYGMGLADITALREHAVERPLEPALLDELDSLVAELRAAAEAELTDEGGLTDEGTAARPTVVTRALLRYEGTDTAVPVTLGPLSAMTSEFEAAYRRRFSFLMPEKRLVVEAVTVEVAAVAEHGDRLPELPAAATPAAPSDRVRLFEAGAWQDVGLFEREALRRGHRVTGPALVTEDNATTVVEPGWEASVDRLGNLVLTRVEARPDADVSGRRADPVLLEVFNNLYMSVAEQMGARLQSTAHSVNIKERLDFSCAVFDAEGNLIANAPHMPVHLGSMGESIKAVLRANAGRIRAGDSYVLNNPYAGGTHLPDVTVVTPVFDEAGERLLFFVASRGHHAEIGGKSPGSMPSDSTRIEEEGVLVDNWLLVHQGRLREAETLDLFRTAEFPSRNPEANLADLRAQVAANEKGVEELRAMVEHFGLDVVAAYMRHVRDNAEEAVRRVVPSLSDGAYSYELDDGSVIEVAVRVDRERREVEIDFTGTSAQLAGNANAPSSVVMAAVLYVFRSLVEDDIPLNAGCLAPIRVVIPDGCLLAPGYPAAVVAGNVETSQAVTGALFAALGAQAEGAGTMNNVTFGNARHQYYETVASGSGAGPGFDGTDVVQTHMTNSRLTDPEVLEWRYPVRVESYEVVPGTGGPGRWRGGDGGRRRIRFLEPMTLNLLSSNRRVAPYGMAGGRPGSLGEQRIERVDGRVDRLPGRVTVEVAAGDVFVIQTPGGGGYGSPGARSGD